MVNHSEHGFALHKSGFQDLLPSKCECGKLFTVEHALSCPKGVSPYSEIRDFTAS